MPAASTAVRPSGRPPGGVLRMRKLLMALRKLLILRACESFASMGFGPQHLVPQSSRRPLYVVKFLPKTKRFTGSEEAAKQLSRRTHCASPADLQFFHTLGKAGARGSRRGPCHPGFPLFIEN